MTSLYRYLLLTILLALAACTPAQPQPQARPTAVLTPAPSPTATETPLPTLTPTTTATPTITPSPTPTITPTPPLSLCQAKTPAPQPAAGTLRIAAVRDGDVWLWTEGDAQPKTLTERGDIQSVRLSPDGELAAFERAVGKSEVEIWVIGTDGKGERRLASAADLDAMGDYDLAYHVLPHNLTWIPGTHVLAFNTFPVLPQAELYAADDLWTIDADSGEIENLLPHRQGGEFVFSPDGTQIALMTPITFSLIKADGADLRWNLLDGYRAVDMGGTYFYPRPVWAADSQSLRIGVPRPEDTVSPHPRILVWDIPLRGFYRTQVTTVEAFPPSLAFSPDLSLLAYITWPDVQSGRRELNLASLNAKPVQSIRYDAGGRLEFLGWAPDSRQFAFWIPASRKLELGSACATPAPLAGELTDYGSVRWVDSNRFLFVTGAPGQWDLLLGQPGGESREILSLGNAAEFDFVVVKGVGN